MMDQHGNTIAQEGVDRCFCGVKYWEHDKCIDCGTHISAVRAERSLVEGDDYTLGRTRIPNRHNTGYTWQWYYALHTRTMTTQVWQDGFATKAEARAAALAAAEREG